MSLRDKRYGLAFQFECEISRPTHLQRLRFGLNFISYMPRISTSALTCILLAGGLVAGCKQKESAPPVPTGYFQTPFQSESEFIVQAVVSDLAEEIVYAASHRLPESNHFPVTVADQGGLSQDAPTYELQVRLGSRKKDLKLALNANGPMWSPAVYETVASELGKAAGLMAGTAKNSEDTILFSKLIGGAPETIEQQNQEVSAALEKDFANPELHEKAAMLLGAFLLREHSGRFFEIRSSLSRITSHLAMARFLGGAGSYGINGQMAEAVMLTLVGDEAPALERLNQIENIAWFSTLADYLGGPPAWQKLTDEQKQAIDFVRIANEGVYSVEMGHELLRLAIPLELKEINSDHSLARHEKWTSGGLARALNELPESCFSAGPDGAVHVHVIGWGHWAMFLQRHLCHAMQQNFYFMDSKWGVHDEARQFAAQCEQQYGALRLYPFVRRFICTDVESYHASVDDGFKITVTTPQLVSAECWNYLCYRVRFAQPYNPNPNPHINEWHNHNPPPGTVYDLHPRLDHPSLVSRRDAVARFEQLHELAPYDTRISNFILKNKYNDRPTYEQAMALFGPLLPYSTYALRMVARTVQDKPEQYEQLMLQAAQLNPASYYDLADYVLGRNLEDKAAEYLDKASAVDPDAVRIASRSEWRVRYYLKKGRTDKAREIADEGGEVYSFAAKIDERYDDPSPLLLFCARYKLRTGDQRFEPEAQKRIRKLFPNGIERVSASDFHGPPTDGVLIRQQNELLQSAGLKAGYVIVAVYGVRVHNLKQYVYARDLKNTPELDLVVWQGNGYREFLPSPPQHRFGLDFVDYRPQ